MRVDPTVESGCWTSRPPWSTCTVGQGTPLHGVAQVRLQVTLTSDAGQERIGGRSRRGHAEGGGRAATPFASDLVLRASYPS